MGPVERSLSTISVEAIRSPATSIDVDLELLITDANKLPSSALALTYSDETKLWSLSDANMGNISSGKRILNGPGFEITISGVPKGGDSFQILPGSNTAGQIRFLLTRPHDLAAASPDLITASNSNLSDAELSMKRVSPSLYPENGVITGDLANSLSAVEAQEFIKDGLITTIPAGTEQVDIASFTKQATAKFNFTGGSSEY